MTTQVREFQREEKERKEKGEGADMGLASDQYAAEVLVSLSGDRTVHSGSDLASPPSVEMKCHEVGIVFSCRSSGLLAQRSFRVLY